MDLVELSRIESSINKFGENFLTRILTKEELEYLTPQRQLTFVAGRFAAKEACVKALGTGFAEGVGFQDISVTNNGAGAPVIKVSGRAKEVADALGAVSLHITITHTEKTAAAVVILEK